MKLHDLHVEPLFESEFVLVASKSRTCTGTTTLASLQNEQWVLPQTNMGYYSELLTTLQRSGINSENIVKTDSVVTIYNLVLNADFLTVIPCDMTTPFGSNQFITIPITEALPVARYAVFIAGRIYETQRGPALHPWHTWSADEMSTAEIDRSTFAGYLAREDAIFHEMKIQLTNTLPDDQKTPLNRFYAQSQVYPQQFQPDWNRSFVLLPEGTPRGAAVLLHGLTDSPYSVRYLAKAYQQQGFVAVVPRLPGHGTAPGSLTAVDWQQWMATTRLAVREATPTGRGERPAACYRLFQRRRAGAEICARRAG